MFTETEFLSRLRDHCLVYDAPTVLPRGHIRVNTKLTYLDGSCISVFVERGNLIRPVGFALSDFGNTFAKLDEYGVNPFQANRLLAIADSARDLKVHVMNDRLVIELLKIEDLDSGILNLSQACLRAACMVFNKRTAQLQSIDEKVHDVVLSSGLPYQSKVKFPGPYDEPVDVDYRVKNPTKHASILVLKGHHAQAIEVYRKWEDLKKASVSDRFLTIYDDIKGVDRQGDLKRLKDISDVVPISQPERIDELLKAA